MRSALHGPEVFLLRSKKSHIQELVKKCYSMTEEEIKKLNEKPDIIKGLLILQKTQSNEDAWERANKIADMMILANPIKFNYT